MKDTHLESLSRRRGFADRLHGSGFAGRLRGRVLGARHILIVAAVVLCRDDDDWAESVCVCVLGTSRKPQTASNNLKLAVF